MGMFLTLWASQGLAGKAFRLAGYVALAGIVFAFLWLLWGDFKQGLRDEGAASEREAGQAIVIDNVEKANEAAERVRSDTAAARADCLRDAGNPENC